MSDETFEGDSTIGRERPAEVDQPEPDEALGATVPRTPDHEPADGDDREVLLDDPASPEPPIDDTADLSEREG